MDDLRIGPIDFFDSRSGLTRDGSKKRARQQQPEPEVEPIDQVTLSSAADTEEQALGYSPPSPDEES
jgi:hypothetical protein